MNRLHRFVNSTRYGIASLLALLACTIVGCANHLDPASEPVHSVDRKLTSATLDITTYASIPVDSPYIEVSATELEQFHTVESEGTAHYDLYTPYQGWREFYEVPLGILALPIAIIGSLVPSSESTSLLDWSVSAINPFLNVEDKNRTERTLIDKNLSPFDEHDESRMIPLAGEKLVIDAHGTSYEKTLDENGKVIVSLLDIYQDTISDGSIKLTIKHDGLANSKELLLSDDLLLRLGKAKSLIGQLDASSNSPGDDFTDKKIISIAQDIRKLSELGFAYDARHYRELMIGKMTARQQNEYYKLMAMSKSTISEEQ